MTAPMARSTAQSKKSAPTRARASKLGNKVGAPAPVDKRPVRAASAGSGFSAFAAIQSLQAVLSAYDHAAARDLALNKSDVACLRLLTTGVKKAREIGTALGLTSGSVTALIDRLEKQKLVKRSTSESDRRAIQVELTPTSLKRLTKAYEPLESALSKALGQKKATTVEAIVAVARALTPA